jgi:hypothetical protein
MQAIDTCVVHETVAIAYVGYDEDANDDLETPVDDILVREYDYHEEDCESEQDEELLFHVPQQLEEVCQSRIPLLEVCLGFFLALVNHLFILEEFMNLVLEEYDKNEAPLLQLRCVPEIL